MSDTPLASQEDIHNLQKYIRGLFAVRGITPNEMALNFLEDEAKEREESDESS